MLTKAKIWLEATRAQTVLASLCPILIGLALAKKASFLNIFILSITVLYGIILHIATNLSNDYYDFLNGADNENRVAPLSTIQTKKTSLKEIKLAFGLCFIFAFILAAILTLKISLFLFFLSLIPIICGFYYTAGKRPLGYMGLGDILVFIFFGPFATLGSYFLQTHEINSTVFLSSLTPGFLSTAILIINNIRDISLDKAANKNTLAVKAGKTFAQIEYLLCIIFASISTLVIYLSTKNIYILVACFIPFFAPIKTVYKFKKPEELNIALQKTVLTLAIYTIIFCIAIFI